MKKKVVVLHLTYSKGFQMANIAVLEDDIRIGKFIKEGLSAASHHVECFGMIDIFIDTLQTQKYDLLIMDRMIGNQDSLSCIKSIKLNNPKIKILILSALAGPIQRINGLEVGAGDYLEKPFQFQELCLRVSNLLKNSEHVQETVMQYLDITLELEGQRMQRAGKNINLSPYEFKMMTLFIKNPQKIQSRTLLLDRVWGCNSGTSSNVVDVAIAKLRKKINFENTQPLISSRRGSGYILSNGWQS